MLKIMAFISIFCVLISYKSYAALQENLKQEEILRLEKRYDFTDNVITSQDIIQDAPFFELFNIEKTVNVYKVKSAFVVDKFKEHNITVISSSPTIEFIRIKQNRIKALEEKIGPLFVEHYAKYNILIQDVFVSPINNINLDTLKLYDYEFPEKAQKRSSGTFVAHFIATDGDIKRVYCRYEIQATLEAIRTTKTLRTGDLIGMNNVEIVRIPFENMGKELMQKSDIEQYSIRSYTVKNSILHKNDLTAKIIIRRGDLVYVLINDGKVLLGFDGVAQQNGAIGKKIRVKNPKTNKSYDAFVIDEKRVEIR